MQEEHHFVDGVDIKSNGRTIAFIRAYVSNKNNSSIKVIHTGIKEAMKHFINEGFDVIRRTGDDYKDGGESLSMHGLACKEDNSFYTIKYHERITDL
jgi:acylphosphatase